jgi:hypothetical protein
MKRQNHSEWHEHVTCHMPHVTCHICYRNEPKDNSTKSHASPQTLHGDLQPAVTHKALMSLLRSEVVLEAGHIADANSYFSGPHVHLASPLHHSSLEYLRAKSVH